MPTYLYKAKKGPAKTVDGEIAAESNAAAVASLDAMGLMPIWVREKTAEDIKTAKFSYRSVSLRDVTMFTRQLASLTKSGVPILRSLMTIRDQTESPALKLVVQDLEASIREGNMLSGAMQAHQEIFPELYINMVRSGESAGALDTVLTRLADAREKDEELRRKIQAAMAYPLLVITVGIITVFVLLSFFLPKVIALFKDFKDLPLPTRILVETSNFFSQNWYWMVLLTLLAAAVYKRIMSMSHGKQVIDGLKLRIPVLNGFLIKADIARFTRTMALLVESGIAIDKAILYSISTLNNYVLREEITGFQRETVRQGIPLSVGLKRSKYFPAIVANMTAVGEETGKLEDALNEIASFYEKEIEQQGRIITSLIEPILILVVGLLVGFIVAAMLLPIFKLGTSFK